MTRHIQLLLLFVAVGCNAYKSPVAARFVTTARFVTNEVVTNRAGIAPFVTWISVHRIVCVCV